MTRPPVYILAGGHSSRFGSDKARALFQDQPLISRVARELRPFAASVTVVADQPDKYQDLDLTTIADTLPGRGPVGGLATALQRTPQPGWALVCCCDALVIRSDWIVKLLEARRSDRSTIAFRGDRWQPFPALYHTSALQTVEHQLHAERLRMQSLLAALNATALPLPGDWPEIWQANTPDQLERAGRQRCELEYD